MKSLAKYLPLVTLLALAGCGKANPGDNTGGVAFDMAKDPCAHCAPPGICCGGKCIDGSGDAKNCGKCGNVCKTNESCTGGVCQCQGMGTCGMGQSCCAGGCKNLMTDGFNCGTCGRACAEGEACTNGGCMKDPACAMCAMQNKVCCNRMCVSTDSDNANCGGCNNPCGAGEKCVQGACMKPVPDGGTGMCTCTKKCMLQCLFNCCIEDVLANKCMIDQKCLGGGGFDLGGFKIPDLGI